MKGIALRLSLIVALVAAAPPLAAQIYPEGYTFLKAIRERDWATAERILSNPSSTTVNYKDPRTGETALHILVRGRDLTWVSFMLGRGTRPDTATSDGTTPVALATQIGWYEGTRLLLARGANPNLGNSRGETPLIFAVQRRDLQMVRLLLSRRADPNQDDSAGVSALDRARNDPRAAPILRLLENAPAP